MYVVPVFISSFCLSPVALVPHMYCFVVKYCLTNHTLLYFLVIAYTRMLWKERGFVFTVFIDLATYKQAFEVSASYKDQQIENSIPEPYDHTCIAVLIPSDIQT